MKEKSDESHTNLSENLSDLCYVNYGLDYLCTPQVIVTNERKNNSIEAKFITFSQKQVYLWILIVLTRNILKMT